VGFSIAGVVIAILFPDDENGGLFITIVAVIAVISNVACELLISKQSRWNFLVSVFIIEVTEIILAAAYSRYVDLIITAAFWVPVDIISYFIWCKHKDAKETELTVVHKFTWWQSLIILGVVVAFSALLGYLIGLIPGAYEDYSWWGANYMDALAGAFGIVNGVLLMFRFHEQWSAWYLSVILQGVLWLLVGQWVMMVLIAGYLVNTTYGSIKWHQYIKKNNIPVVKFKLNFKHKKQAN